MNERERLETLINFNILEKLPESVLNPFVKTATILTQSQIGFLFLCEDERYLIKTKIGLNIYDMQNDFEFCFKIAHQNHYFEVSDAYKHPDFHNHRMVLGQPNFRFLGAYPLITNSGNNIGCLCVLDSKPKQLNFDQIESLKNLAEEIIVQLELRKQNKNLQSELNQLIHDKVNQTEIDLAYYKFALDQSAEVAITDRDGYIKFVNDKFCKTSKYEKAELLGQPYKILNSGYHSHLYFKELWQTIEKGKVWNGEIKNKDKNGRFYWVDCQIIPFPDKKGSPHQYVAIQQDITAKKSTLERLKLETALISILSENAAIEPTIKKLCEQISLFLRWDVGLYWQLDDKKERLKNPIIVPFTYKNIDSFMETCRKFEFKKGEGLIGYVWVNKKPKWIDKIDGNSVVIRENIIEDSGFKSHLSFPIIFNNEVNGVMEFFTSNINQSDENMIEMFETLGLQIGSYMERRVAEEELIKAKKEAEESVKSKDQFLTNMSHEIRTPMNAILGFTELLEKTKLNHEQEEFAGSVKMAAQNLLSIINDILDFSKIESGTMYFEEVSTDITTLINNIKDLLKFSAQNKNLDFYCEIDSKIPKNLICDPIRLNQILINLVGNAIKFTEVGKVVLSADLYKSDFNNCSIKFSVRDTGIGIPIEKQNQIFERFQQVDNEINRKYEGTGLGLSISKNLIELMGGKLEIESVPGQGSEFSFELSFKIGRSENSSEDENIEKIEFEKTKQKSILLVEDNLLNQKLAANVLQNQGFDVEVAENGKVGLEKLKQLEYDLVLMDIQMPELDGYQTTKIIRNELKMDIPIIAMTAHSIVGEKEKCLNAGMNDFISKPFDQKDLNKKINALIDHQKKTSNNGYASYKPSNSMINLTYLYELSNGNKSFEKEMISLFLHQVPKEFINLQQAYDEGKFQNLFEMAHKMKSSMEIFDRKDLAEHLNRIMTIASKNNKDVEIDQSLNAIELSLNEFYPVLNEILEKNY